MATQSLSTPTSKVKTPIKSPEHVNINYTSIGGEAIDLNGLCGRLGMLAIAFEEVRQQAENEGFTGLEEKAELIMEGIVAICPDLEAQPPDPVTQARMFLREERRRARALVAEEVEESVEGGMNEQGRKVYHELQCEYKKLLEKEHATLQECNALLREHVDFFKGYTKIIDKHPELRACDEAIALDELINGSLERMTGGAS